MSVIVTPSSFISSFAFWKPRPPAPINATFTLSLGAVNPGPPRTWRGTMVAAVAAADVLRNLRRELVMVLPDKLIGEAIDLQLVYQESTRYSGFEAAVRLLSGNPRTVKTRCVSEGSTFAYAPGFEFSVWLSSGCYAAERAPLRFWL